MITSTKVYPGDDSISIVFDKSDPHELWLLRVLEDSFGDACVIPEDLNAHHCCLHLRPGGLRKVQQ